MEAAAKSAQIISNTRPRVIRHRGQRQVARARRLITARAANDVGFFSGQWLGVGSREARLQDRRLNDVVDFRDLSQQLG